LITEANEIFVTSFTFCSPYAYNFGLGKRADADELSNYDDDAEFYDGSNYDKAGLNMENWENGGYMDNKNDIDVLDYDFAYPRGELMS
jgi:hypothetical protein